MNSNIIQERQNDETLLKIQYAARKCFNSAEKYNYFSLVVCLVSGLSVLSPESWNEDILNMIRLALDIMAMLFCAVASNTSKWGATLRKYFDAQVLDICANQFSESEIQKILEKTENIFLKNPEKAATQINNTGHDSPPGVKDWYEFSAPFDGVKAQFECQKQNIWWTQKMMYRRLCMTVCLSIGIIFFFGVLIAITNHSVLSVLLCSGGIIFKIVERLVQNIKYFYVSLLILGSKIAVEAKPATENVERLQLLIDEFRSINVQESNFIHRKVAAKLSNLYQSTQ